MSEFTRCFLLVFGQLAVGGIAGLAVPPFAVLERGFYKSSAGVFAGCAIGFLLGRVGLVVRTGAVSTSGALELAAWAIFALATSLYLASLWGESNTRRARAYVAALFSGLAALSVSAILVQPAPLFPAGFVLYPIAFITGALSLGAVATGMLLGHWYLIDLGLSIEPLARMFRYFMWVLVLHLAAMALALVVAEVSGGAGAVAVATLFREHTPLLLTRIVLGPVAALALGYMISRTLQIPQTMAATGLFYIAILAVVVGELLGRLILFRTALPL